MRVSLAQESGPGWSSAGIHPANTHTVQSQPGLRPESQGIRYRKRTSLAGFLRKVNDRRLPWREDPVFDGLCDAICPPKHARRLPKVMENQTGTTSASVAF